MHQDEVEDALSLLKRLPFLSAIRDERLTRRELQERLGVTRTTVYRTTVDLEERELIERTDAGYRLTARGVGATAATEYYGESLALTNRLRPLLEFVDHPLLLRSLHLFADAEILRLDPNEPLRIGDWMRTRIGRTDRYRSLGSAYGSGQRLDEVVESAKAGTSMEVVYSRRDLQWWFDLGEEQMSTILAQPNCTAYVHDDLPSPLNLFDDTVVVVGVDERTGLPGVCAVTACVEAADWAETMFRRYRREAEPVDVEELVA